MPVHVVRPAAIAVAAAVVALTAAAQPPTTPAEAVKALDRLAAADKYPLKHDAKQADAVLRDRVAWFAAGGVKVFEKTAAPADPGYEAARAGLARDAVVRAQLDLSGQADWALGTDARKHLRDAAAAGSKDPFVRYLVEWQPLRAGTPDPALAAAFGRTVDELCKSGYGDDTKMNAAYNWLSLIGRLPADDPLGQTKRAATDQFWRLFEKVAADPHPASGAAVLDLVQAHAGFAARAGRTRRQNYDVMADRLVRAKAPAVVRLTAEGTMLVKEAWDARGDGPATTVTPEGIRVFRERLAEARAALEAAWEADPTRPEAATQMLHVCRGLGLGREELETWFARAIAVNPHNGRAVLQKLDSIHPRWGGTGNGFYGFAWAVANSPNTEAQFPLAAVTAIVRTAQVVGPAYDRNPDAMAKFLAQPGVWVTLKTALERQLQASPKNVYVRSMFARLAGVARQYDTAHAQFQALRGEFNPTYFPTRAEFERWAEEARRAVEMKP